MAGIVGRSAHYEVTYRQAPPSQEGLIQLLLRGLGQIAGQLLKAVGHLLARFPLLGVVAAVLGLAQWRHVAGQATVAMVVLLVGVLVVRWRCRDWWARRFTIPRQRRDTIKGLVAAWPVLCDRVGLTVTDRDRRSGAVIESTPALSGLVFSDTGAVLSGRLDLVPGQLVDDFGAVSERLAEATRAQQCRIIRTSPGVAQLRLLYGDPLCDVIPPLPIAEVPDLEALPVGLREDGQPWLLRVRGTHVLTLGSTGAGKSSLIRAVLRGLAAPIHAGLVQVWAIDGKAGMELAPAKPLFARFATTCEAGVELLELAARTMHERAERLSTQSRVHTPSVAEPFVLVLVDELALLTAYQPDRKLRERTEQALGWLTTQGRGVGFAVLASAQDPRKEVLSLRHLFPTKIAMRLQEKVEVDMILGSGSRDAGALCDRIPESLPGIGYVKVDGQREPLRVRAAYCTDADIAGVAAAYPAPVVRGPGFMKVVG